MPKTKTVRIVSPHSSVSDNDNPIRHGSFIPPSSYASPPPLESGTIGSPRANSPINPFSIESDEGEATTEDEDLRKNTIGNAGHRSASNTTSKMSPKPFQKTITKDAFGTSTLDAGERSENGVPNALTSAMRPHYDVDEFKRLLLTGERSVAEASALSTPSIHSQGTQNVGDTSSNTDASSISRYSIFEPLPGVSQDTPRTSHEVSPSGEERQLAVQKPSARIEGVRPLASKPRRGSPATGTVSQTVSFHDAGLSLQSSSNSNMAFPGWSTLSSPRTLTDLNKPLPLPPATGPLEDAIQKHAPSANKPQSEIFEPQGPQINSPPLKQDPPAPPLARRHSQRHPKSSIGPSGGSMRISEENLVVSKPQPQCIPSMSSKPPLPPPRRSGLTRSLSTASSSSSVSAFRAPSTSSATEDGNTKSSKYPPPLPPTRTPSISSVKRPLRPSPNAKSSPTAAPPLPPRRRGSSHGSVTQNRSSGEYRSDRYRSDSGASSIPPVAATPLELGTDDKDVLADLTALQREVDELRGKLK